MREVWATVVDAAIEEPQRNRGARAVIKVADFMNGGYLGEQRSDAEPGPVG
jgi:hypothetical protein